MKEVRYLGSSDRKLSQPHGLKLVRVHVPWLDHLHATTRLDSCVLRREQVRVDLELWMKGLYRPPVVPFRGLGPCGLFQDDI
jgi:hypothetical protein